MPGKILLDVHTHSIVSGHAYSTIREMALQASRLGLKILGITEHGPAIPGTCDPLYFRNLIVVPREMYGVKLLLGSEMNILDTKGTLDLSPEYQAFLDIRIAGIHNICYKAGTADENTAGVIAAIRTPGVHIISHPADGSVPLHFEPLVLAAKEAHTLLEINNHSLHPKRHKTEAKDNTIELLNLCKKYEVPVILGSDAHMDVGIATYGRLYPLLAQTEFPDELIMNDKPEAFLGYTGIEA